MKKLLFIILLSTTLIGYTQTDFKKSEVKTTDEEYNFLTESYDIENNIEILDGYELKTLGFFDYEKFRCETKFLVESKTKNVKAISFVLSKEKENNDKIRYLCLPINNEVLFKKFKKKHENLGFTISEVLNHFGNLMISGYVEQIHNSNNKDVKTTDEEYEFLTMKYPTLNNDLLEGYQLKPFIDEIIEEKYKYNYQLFVESETQNVKAVLITLTKLKNNDDKIKYLCMPLNNQELYTKFKAAIINLGVNMGFYLDVSNFSLVAKIVDNRYNSK